MSPTDDQLWTMIRTARADLAVDLSGLSVEQWRAPSLCGDWDVEHVVAHLTAAASVGRWRWIASIVASGFRPAVHNARRLREQLGDTPARTLAAFEAVVDSRIAPSSDLAAYLGEVVVHGQDIRRPLGLPTPIDPAAVAAVAEFYASRNFAVPSRTTVRGLRLEATDTGFAFGDGPLVAGPTLALVMVMAGRPAYLAELDGPGVATLHERLDG